LTELLPDPLVSPLLDLSKTEIPGQIQENMIVYMRLFAGLPGMVMRDDPQIFWFIANKIAPGDNILRVHLESRHIEDQIDQLFHQIGNYIDEISWMIFPGDSPPDLGAHLEARGMPGGPAGNWLWANLDNLRVAPAVPAGFHIEQVLNDAMMAVWLRVSEEGFGSKLGCFYDAYARHGYASDAFSLHYIGYLGDTPVTSGTLLDAGNTASIYDVSTPPAYRKQGFGGALTHHLMDEIRKRGYHETWIWSSNMARKLYRSLGYIDADFGVREHVWKKG